MNIVKSENKKESDPLPVLIIWIVFCCAWTLLAEIEDPIYIFISYMIATFVGYKVGQLSCKNEITDLQNKLYAAEWTLKILEEEEN